MIMLVVVQRLDAVAELISRQGDASIVRFCGSTGSAADKT